MLKITIISVGGMKEKYFAEAIAEYEKRSSAFAQIKNINLKEEPIFDARDAEIAAALDAEGEQILKNLPPRAYKVALCVEGKQLSSEELAAMLHEVKETHGEVCFVIGSSHGLAEKVKAACDRRLSFSRLTFPHRLMRVILSEALYRALSIEGGGKYHK